MDREKIEQYLQLTDSFTVEGAIWGNEQSIHYASLINSLESRLNRTLRKEEKEVIHLLSLQQNSEFFSFIRWLIGEIDRSVIGTLSSPRIMDPMVKRIEKKIAEHPNPSHAIKEKFMMEEIGYKSLELYQSVSNIYTYWEELQKKGEKDE